MPLFSVIIPTYNRREKLLRCIGSVKGNRNGDCEIIVVDDGSLDDTEAKVREYHPDVTYIKQANRGVSHARNKGMQVARGRYFAFLDADDVWDSNRLFAVESVLKMIPRDVGLIFNDMYIIGSHSAKKESSSSQYFGINFERYFEKGMGVKTVYNQEKNYYIRFGKLFESLLQGNFVSPSCAVIRREVYEDIGGFREDFSVAEDNDFFLRVAKRYKVGFLSLPLTGVELPDSPISLSRPENNLLKVMNCIITVTQLGSDALDPGIRRSLRRRVAKLNSLAAYHHLSTLNRREARRFALRSIIAGPSLYQGYLYLALTALPARVLSAGADMKRIFRRRRA